MGSSNNEEIISNVSPHTIKKFEIIEEYAKTWIYKLLNCDDCKYVVFVDCMCNSGVYLDDDDNIIYGTPIRISKLIHQAMSKYPQKRAILYFNDLSIKKINELIKHLPRNTHNFGIRISCKDGNQLLKEIKNDLCCTNNLHYLLVYDPYQAIIDWEAIEPFLNHWGEVIINHMVSDSLRGVKLAKKEKTIEKYQQTYQTQIYELIQYGSNRKAFETRIEDIITKLHKKNNMYYVAAFPFFNSKNALVYTLIHCTNSMQGFKLYKKTAWKIFGGKSSAKNTSGIENQLVLDFTNQEELVVTLESDEYCYNVHDITQYLINNFKGQNEVSEEDIWKCLDNHPIFPSDGYKREIKHCLKEQGYISKYKKISFNRS